MTISKRLFVFFCLIFSLAIQGETYQEERSFNKEAMQAFAESNDFAYMNLTIQPPSLWQRLQWWLAGIFQRIFSNPNTAWLSDILFYGLLLLVLGIAGYYIIRLRYGTAVSAESKYFGGSAAKAVGLTEDADYENLIKEAISNQNHKLAIRYVYLRSLKFLSEKGLVKLKDYKSPYDYTNELKSDVALAYKDLSKLFEYVWYGDFNAGESEYNVGVDLERELQNRVE